MTASRDLVARAARSADREAWDAFVASRPEADVLQAWAWGEAGTGEPHERWARVLVETPGGDVGAAAQLLSRAAMLGRRVLYVPHGPVWDRDAPDRDAILDAILAGMLDHARSERGIVVKLDPRATPGGPVRHSDGPASLDPGAALADRGLRRARHDLQAPTTRLLDISGGADAVMARWSRDARAETRRAGREGVLARVVREADARWIDAFHSLLGETAERGGFRIRSRDFLGRLAGELARTGDWFLAFAESDGRPIAAAVAARTGDRAFYLYAASTRDEATVHKRGPYAVMAALCGALSEAGVRTLDLWGVREPDDPSAHGDWEGFSLFKRRFGGAPLRHPGTFDLVVDPAWDRLREIRERLRDRRP